jgi:hypothetical protein
MSKYGARKTVLDGITFDSLAEARRWQNLRLLERGGHITNLRRQVAYELAPAVLLAGAKRKKPAIRFIADFVYQSGAATIVEDVKGVVLPVFRMKLHLMKTVHNIDVLVTK